MDIALENDTLVVDNSTADDWWSTIFVTEYTAERVTFGEFVFRTIGAAFCILLVIATVFGNTLVIIVVAKFYRMRTVTNILLAR